MAPREAHRDDDFAVTNGVDPDGKPFKEVVIDVDGIPGESPIAFAQRLTRLFEFEDDKAQARVFNSAVHNQSRSRQGRRLRDPDVTSGDAKLVRGGGKGRGRP